MIAAVESHVLERLGKIKKSSNAYVRVYGPGANRPKGITEYPSIAVQRWVQFDYDSPRARPYLDVFTPSAKTYKYTIPEWFGGGELEGPESWSWKKLPTPVFLTYQVDLLAEQQGHVDGLLLALFEAFPIPYRAEVDGGTILMLQVGDTINLNELEKPLFRTAIRYEISNIWVDRAKTFEVPGIQDIGLSWGDWGG